LVSAAGRVLRASRDNRLLILIYHRVQPSTDPMFPGEVDAATFDWQMGLLRRHCVPLSLRQGVSLMRAGKLPERAVAVTFDDGYADNAAVALPILQRHAVPATFFVATGFLNGGLMWNDAIIESVRRATRTTLDLPALGVGRAELGDLGSRGPLADRIIRAVKHLPQSERAAHVRAIQEQSRATLPVDLMMTSGQVRQLADAGMEIGAHTTTHPILRTLDAQQAREEIDRSRRELEAMISSSVTLFAYPNGRPGDDYTRRDRDLVESLGFELAVSTQWGVATRASDCFQFPRFTPWDPTPTRWLARLLLMYRQAA
jgi:peptidoglycan/xylan/chitin deacetylase (PgdA/CDA1 family)